MTKAYFSGSEPIESVEDIPKKFLLEGTLTLTEQGKWLFNRDEIKHLGVCNYLIKSLKFNQEGAYWIVNGPQRALVEIEDTPFLIQELIPQKGGIFARINDGESEFLDLNRLTLAENGMIYARVKEGKSGAVPGKTHRARLSKEAFFQLAPYLSEENGTIVLAYQKKTYALGVEK